jgi:hypothetical protein
MRKLPFKMSIFKIVAERGPVSEDEIVRALVPDYGGERQFSARAVEKHLLSLRAIGLINDEPGANAAGEVSFSYTAAPAALEKLKRNFPAH